MGDLNKDSTSFVLAHGTFLKELYLKMPNFTVNQMREAMDNAENIRNMSVIAHVDQRPGTPIYNLQAYLPVLESFCFVSKLREATSGQAFPQCIFDHWEEMNGDALDEDDKLGELVRSIRKRKKLSDDVPPLDRYMDKL